MPSRGSRAHTNPELADFLKGRESEAEQSDSARPGGQAWAQHLRNHGPSQRLRFRACRLPDRLSPCHGPVREPVLVVACQGVRPCEQESQHDSKLFALSLHAILAAVALYYDDLVMVSDLKKNYDLYFPIYFANRVKHPLADSWLIEGIGAPFMSDRLSINMSWDYFLIDAFAHLARRRRVMEKAGKDVNGLGITEDLLMQFWKDTASLDQSGWDKVTRMLDPKIGSMKHAIELLKPPGA